MFGFSVGGGGGGGRSYDAASVPTALCTEPSHWVHSPSAIFATVGWGCVLSDATVGTMFVPSITLSETYCEESERSASTTRASAFSARSFAFFPFVLFVPPGK